MATKKKAAVKKAAAKKGTAKPAAKPAVKAVSEPFNKTALIGTLAERTQLKKTEVAAVLGELENIIHAHVKKRAAGSFTLPGLLKIVTVKKPARKARKNVPNPFKPGETMDVAAKPAQTVIKVRPLKKLKTMAES